MTTFFVVINIFKRIVSHLGMVSGIALMGVMGLMCTEVFCRYVLHSPILGTVEVSEQILVFVVYLGIAYTQQIDGHIRIEVVTELLSPRVRHILRIFALLVALGVFALITWRSGMTFWEAWLIKEVRWGALPLPTWPVKGIVPVGSFILCLQFITDIIDELSGHPEKHSAGEVL